MIEIVNPMHPDKIADRIAGAMVDLAYQKEKDPKIAVEVLIGHGRACIMTEASVKFSETEIKNIVHRVSGLTDGEIYYVGRSQDTHLADNQKGIIRCGDNGIFKGAPRSAMTNRLADIARKIYKAFPTDGKYILSQDGLIVCQSNATAEEIRDLITDVEFEAINPLGDWTGGIDVDCGATNRKLGSDMAEAVTGGGLHGKDLSKADVSVNIVCDLLARSHGEEVYAKCAIGDDMVAFHIGSPTSLEIRRMFYDEVVERARAVIENVGGFEKFAEWGLNYISPFMA